MGVDGHGGPSYYEEVGRPCPTSRSGLRARRLRTLKKSPAIRTLKSQINSSTGLYEKIWRVVARIPRGKVATYGQIARLAGLVNGARRVGYALHALPPGFPVPWQRVINAQGRISFPPSHPNHRKQKKLLGGEGIWIAGERIDLTKYRWRGTRTG